MSKYFPLYGDSSNEIKVKLDPSNYATKTDLKDITHVDVSDFASKTNLAALKTEVDKIDTDKLKTVPDELAKLSNVVKNGVVKKVDYNTLKTKVDGTDTSNFVTRTKFTADADDLDDKIDKVDKKIPDVSSFALKSSITSLLPTSTFNSKVTEFENETTGVDNKVPSITGLAIKTAVENKIPNVAGYVKKADYATEITSTKNDYATNASLDSKLNDLKAQRIKDEVKKVDDKVTKNSSDILGLENRLKQKEDIVDEVQRENSTDRGFRYYTDKSYLRYECKIGSFSFSSGRISVWKSTGLFNFLGNSNLNPVGD